MTQCWIPGEGAPNSSSYIVRQVGSRRYMVKNTVSGRSGVVSLGKLPLSEGQGVIMFQPAHGEAQPARSIWSHRVMTWGGNTYAWRQNAVSQLDEAAFFPGGQIYQVTVLMSSGLFRNGDPEVPAWVPSGATDYIDLVTGDAYANGLVTTVDDFFNLIGARTDANGMVSLDGTAVDVEFVGALADAVQLGNAFTLVFEFDMLDQPIRVRGQTTGFEASFTVGQAASVSVNATSMTGLGAVASGRNRFAISFDPGQPYRAAFNGGVARSLAATTPYAWTNGEIVSVVLRGTSAVRSLALYPVQTDASLSAISAL